MSWHPEPYRTLFLLAVQIKDLPVCFLSGHLVQSALIHCGTVLSSV